MKRFVMTVSILGLIIGVTIFPEQVLGLFRGKSPLESMQMIATFILHVVTVTIGLWVVYTLPEIFGPWMKVVRGKILSLRIGKKRRGLETPPHSVGQRMPRLTTAQMLQMLMMQQSQRSPRRDMPNQPAGQDEIRIDF
jgi:hypothetical protein